ncbi:hypothetical protein M433DRAFT_157059 [Acidomyces richmondensis BFW]|nr:hypothetical protein M433DRAFT_157059 [Acidomyces richmondensis BFW]
MGMAFQSIAASGQRPYFKTLIDENKVSNPEFSFYLGRTKSGTQGNSELTLGGSDSSKYTDTPTKIAVSTPGYWHIPLDGVSVNAIDTALDVTIDKGQAAIDTGTTIILAPSIASTDIFARIPGSIPIPLELIDGSIEPILYAYPCSSTPRVAITFGGKNFDISEFSNHTNLPPPFLQTKHQLMLTLLPQDPLDFNFGTLTPSSATFFSNNTLTNLLGKAQYCFDAISADDIDPTENLYVVVCISAKIEVVWEAHQRIG